MINNIKSILKRFLPVPARMSDHYHEIYKNELADVKNQIEQLQKLTNILLGKCVLPERKVVYTAITGNYEILKSPETTERGWDYVCFTDDQNLKSDFWDVRYISTTEAAKLGALNVDNPRRLSKFFKMFPEKLFPDYDASLWVDAAFHIVGSINEYVATYLKNTDMLCFVHPVRNCVYQEADKCVSEGLSLREETNKQISKYRMDGFPEHHGLIAAGLLYRGHTDAVTKLNDFWYLETMSGTPRDQLSFDYCAWKLGFKYDVCSLNAWDNPYFKFEPHHAEQKRLYPKLYAMAKYPPSLLLSDDKAISSVLGYPDGRFEVVFHFDELHKEIRCLKLDPCQKDIEMRIDLAVLKDNEGQEYHLEPFDVEQNDKSESHNQTNTYYFKVPIISSYAEVTFYGNILALSIIKDD